MKIAVIDLGTNTFQLLIAEGQAGNPHFTPLRRERVFVKIGRGGIQEGLLTPEAFERALQTYCKLHALALQSGVALANIHATATSAIRSAANGPLLITQMNLQTGTQPRTILGDEEASLIYFGVRTVLNMGKEPHLIVDIGGGSVEFICCDHSSIHWKQSFEAGAQRLYTKFHHTEPMSITESAALTAYLEATFAPLRPIMEKFSPKYLVGCAGTFSTMREIYAAAQPGVTIAKGQIFRLERQQYLKMHQWLCAMDAAERLAVPGMLAERSDMIVVASAIVQWLLNEFPLQEIIVSPASLKEGLLSQIFTEARQA